MNISNQYERKRTVLKPLLTQRSQELPFLSPKPIRKKILSLDSQKRDLHYDSGTLFESPSSSMTNSQAASSQNSPRMSRIKSINSCMTPVIIRTEAKVKTILQPFDARPRYSERIKKQTNSVLLNNIDNNDFPLFKLSKKKHLNLKDKTTLKMINLFNNIFTKNEHDQILETPFKDKEHFVKTFRSKVIYDYKSNFSPDQAKYTAKNYEREKKYFEFKEELKHDKAKNNEEMFKKAKNTASSISSPKKFHITKKLDTRRRSTVAMEINRNSVLIERPLNQLKQEGEQKRKQYQNKFDELTKGFAESVFNLDAPDYEDCVTRKGVKDFEINYNNLNRKIKLAQVYFYKYDVEDDVLLEKNPDELRKLINDAKDESMAVQRQCRPAFIKKKFSKETLKKFKGFTGNYFGVPV